MIRWPCIGFVYHTNTSRGSTKVRSIEPVEYFPELLDELENVFNYSSEAR